MEALTQAALVGVFEELILAEKAYNDLLRAGFDERDLSLKTSMDEALTHDPNAGVPRGIRQGELWSFFGDLFTGVDSGPFAEGVSPLAAFTEEERDFYEHQFHRGRTIVIVRARQRLAEASAIFAQHHAYHTKTYQYDPANPLDVIDERIFHQTDLGMDEDHPTDRQGV